VRKLCESKGTHSKDDHLIHCLFICHEPSCLLGRGFFLKLYLHSLTYTTDKIGIGDATNSLFGCITKTDRLKRGCRIGH
jgi:hypothetical protein